MIADGKNTLLKIGGNGDIITCWRNCYEQFKNQPNDLGILDEIRYVGSVDDKCMAVFGYLCENVSYRLDDKGYQWIKSPARLLQDGKGDCKSLTMFIASCLHCLGIQCKVRFVNFDGGDQYTHVDPVAIDEGGNEIAMDMCETDTDGTPLYGYAREYSKKKEFLYQ